MTPFYREVQPLDPELAAIDRDYWFDHADEDLEAVEERAAIIVFEKIRTGDLH